MSRNLMVVLTNTEPGKEDEFNRWYDDVHVGDVLSVPQVKACTRYEVTDADSDYRYLALYEFEGDPDALMKAMGEQAARFDMSGPLAGAPRMLRAVPLGPRVESP